MVIYWGETWSKSTIFFLGFIEVLEIHETFQNLIVFKQTTVLGNLVVFSFWDNNPRNIWKFPKKFDDGILGNIIFKFS